MAISPSLVVVDSSPFKIIGFDSIRSALGFPISSPTAPLHPQLDRESQVPPVAFRKMKSLLVAGSRTFSSFWSRSRKMPGAKPDPVKHELITSACLCRSDLVCSLSLNLTAPTPGGKLSLAQCNGCAIPVSQWRRLNTSPPCNQCSQPKKLASAT
jgi:hypothetical protein